MVTAERQLTVEGVIGVHPHRAGLQATRDSVGEAEVFRPQGSRETIFRIIGRSDDFVFVRKRDRDRYRSEDLFFDDGHIRGRVGKDRRFDVVTSIAPSVATDERFGTIGFCLLQGSQPRVLTVLAKPVA